MKSKNFDTPHHLLSWILLAAQALRVATTV
jgi:hypothetical protein